MEKTAVGVINGVFNQYLWTYLKICKCQNTDEQAGLSWATLDINSWSVLFSNFPI